MDGWRDACPSCPKWHSLKIWSSKIHRCYYNVVDCFTLQTFRSNVHMPLWTRECGFAMRGYGLKMTFQSNHFLLLALFISNRKFHCAFTELHQTLSIKLCHALLMPYYYSKENSTMPPSHVILHPRIEGQTPITSRIDQAYMCSYVYSRHPITHVSRVTL